METILKPILFSTEMVKAILEGKKTQTRRIMKPQPKEQKQDFPIKVSDFVQNSKADLKKGYSQLVTSGDLKGFLIPNAKHQKDDILWVREVFHYAEENEYGVKYIYKSDVHPNLLKHHKFKPSIHMPKEAARIFLKVTDVRCECLNDISLENCYAEGVEFIKSGNKDVDDLLALESFMKLWESINGKDSWFLNSWVWVYTFEKIEKPKNWLS